MSTREQRFLHRRCWRRHRHRPLHHHHNNPRSCRLFLRRIPCRPCRLHHLQVFQRTRAAAPAPAALVSSSTPQSIYYLTNYPHAASQRGPEAILLPRPGCGQLPVQVPCSISVSISNNLAEIHLSAQITRPILLQPCLVSMSNRRFRVRRIIPRDVATITTPQPADATESVSYCAGNSTCDRAGRQATAVMIIITKSCMTALTVATASTIVQPKEERLLNMIRSCTAIMMRQRNMDNTGIPSSPMCTPLYLQLEFLLLPLSEQVPAITTIPIITIATKCRWGTLRCQCVTTKTALPTMRTTNCGRNHHGSMQRLPPQHLRLPIFLANAFTIVRNRSILINAWSHLRNRISSL
mmetsp:Transcript_7155/g.21117  ORF Transcript_7155/g.21117 Transcript_7155/m.21117 type:complete len:352 (-) Transcript_7155:574-1629(-)